MNEFAIDDDGVEREIVSRKESIEKDLDRYFTGKPCKHGHVYVRYGKYGNCVKCVENHRKSKKGKAQRKKYKVFNKDKINSYQREYSKRHHVKKKMRNYLRSYEKSEKRKTWKSRYRSSKYRNDPSYKVSRICRSHLRRIIRMAGCDKNHTTFELLGYRPDQFKTHIESNFIKGMSWDNYGVWHIDHKYPISRYISDGIKDPSTINHLDNLIPMWAEDNLDKSSMTLEEYLEEYPEKKELYGHFLD